MVQYDARVLHFPTLHPEVLKLHPDLKNLFASFRVALSPPKGNNAFISVRPNPKASFSISLDKSLQFLLKVKDKYMVKRESKESVKLYTCFPAYNWQGMSWFSYDELVALKRKGYESLLQKNFVHPQDAKPFLGWKDTGMGYCTKTNKIVRKGKPKYTYNGCATINLLQAIERMPVNGSVRATTGDMGFDMVKRSYLEYLVYDGDGVGTGMKSAIASIPGSNALRDSIILYLNKSNDALCNLEVRSKGNYVIKEGVLFSPQSYACDPLATRAIRKQWERIDIPEPRDLDWKPFCTFGYYDKDTFVGSGLPYKLVFESHGVPTWIKREVKNEEEKSPEHFQSLEEWERNAPWQDAEEVADFKPFIPPTSFSNQVKWFWDLKKQVVSFTDRWEHHMGKATVERSEKDERVYMWDREDLESQYEKMVWESKEVLKLEERLKNIKVVKEVLRELKKAKTIESDQESKAKEWAKIIYEWIAYDLVGRAKIAKRDEKLLAFNLKKAKHNRVRLKNMSEVVRKKPFSSKAVCHVGTDAASFYYL